MSAEPYYSDPLVTLYHGDALDVLGLMSAASIDIAVTSPPYNMGLSPGGNGRGLYTHTTSKGSRFSTEGYGVAGDDSMDPEEYAALRVAELQEMWRIVTAAIFYNHRPRVIHGVLADPLDVDQFGMALPAPIRQRIILARPTGIDVNLNHFCTRGEYLLLFAKPTFRLVDHAASGMGDVWNVPIVSDSDHPAPFAEMIPARCLAATGASSVLDPFCGSGTTLLAAKRAGIRAVGIERSERFCEMAAERLGGPIRHDADSLFALTAPTLLPEETDPK